MHKLLAAAFPLALAACAAQPVAPVAQAVPPAVETAKGPTIAPLSELVEAVDIPYETFTLPNGLRTIVHTDRKTPVVGVTVYYRVGSKNEPRGKTGFAHLFEHLMFGGSENVPNFDIPLEASGSTGSNGSTWLDRTNYVETVPTGSLPLTLFLESDRMGYLLGAVTQDKLDKQRGVVQNEKREGDNQPYGLVDYVMNADLLPVGHPYRHATIGSMADLDAASLTDVRRWFIDNYGPNNVVLALAGDIDAATARPLVEKWFGDIPRGPDVKQPVAGPVTLAQPVSREITDQVPVTRIYRAWTGPALTDPYLVPLEIGMDVLGGLASSRLDNTLVRGEELAVSVSASVEDHELLSYLTVQMDVKPDVDRALAERRLDEVIADLVSNGPSEDEVLRATTSRVSGTIGALELVGGFSGKGAALAEGMLYAGDPNLYKIELERAAATTPAEIRAAMQRWLTRPAYKLAVVPGERTEDGAKMGGWGDEDTVPPPAPDTGKVQPPAITPTPREAPPIEETRAPTFPQIERATLSNGIPVALARRTAVPKLSMAIQFDAGYASDDLGTAGTQSLMMSMLDEGTNSRDANTIAEEQERLGASISSSASLDTSTISMTALSANLAPSLELMADIVRNPAFAPEDVSRVKDQRLAAIQQQLASPFGLAQRAVSPLIYGPQHPYGSVGPLGTSEAVAALTPSALKGAHDTWLRPDLARITVVGDITMERLLPMLERAFGDWRAPAAPAPTKNLEGPMPQPRQHLVVIDRPNSPQSVIVLARVLPLAGTDPDQDPVELANEVIGSGFLSRLNSDLREDKGWTYGISSSLGGSVGPRDFTVYTPVQSDRTADSIRLILDDMKAFPATDGVNDIELQRVTEGNIRYLPNRFQTNSQVLSGILQNQRLGRPDDYFAKLPAIYSAIDKQAIDHAAEAYLQPDDMVIVVVGDRKQIDDQLGTLGMPIEYLDASDL